MLFVLGNIITLCSDDLRTLFLDIPYTLLAKSDFRNRAVIYWFL